MARIFIFLSSLLLCAVSSIAKDDSQYKVILKLKDGKEISGYIRTSIMDGVSKVGISDSPKGSYLLYEAEQIESLTYPPSPEDTTTITYVPLRASGVPSLFKKNPKPSKKPILMRKVYSGKNVDGYVVPCVDVTMGSTTRIYSNTYRYYYKLASEDYARAYWFASDGIAVGTKAALKLSFPEKAMEAFENGTITVSDFAANPEIMVPILDSTLE